MFSDLPPLDPHSLEYGLIEYKLQKLFSAYQLRLKEGYSFKNHQQDKIFESLAQKVPKSNVIDAFLPAHDIYGRYDFSTKTLNIDHNNPLKFCLGIKNIDKNASIIELVHVQAIVGNPLNFQQERDDFTVEFSNANPTIADKWRGWESLRVSPDLEYVIFEKDQIKLFHFIKLDGGDNISSRFLEENRCSKCNNNERVLYRLRDETRLCRECVTEKKMLKYLLEVDRHVFIEESSVCCPEHKGTRVEHFCFTCGVPVCIECKLTGSHSTGEKATHKLVHIDQAIQQIQSQIQPLNQKLLQKALKAQRKLECVNGLLDFIEKNHQEVVKEIQEAAEVAIQKSKRIAFRKSVVVNSFKCELERQLEECYLFQMNPEKLRQILSDVEFVTSFPRFQTAVNEIIERADDFLEPAITSKVTLGGCLDVLDPGFAPQVLKTSPITERSVKTSRAYVPYSLSSDSSASGHACSKSKIRYSRSKPNQILSSSHRHHCIDPSTSTSFETSPFKLSILALDGEKKLNKKEKSFIQSQFEGSSILTNKLLTKNLYLALPFKHLPNTELLFSTIRDGRSMSKLHAKVDNVGTTIVIVQKGDQIFGGFASTKWISNSRPFGEYGENFLFNLTKDAFLKYKEKSKNACPLFASPNTLCFGKHDLVLAKDFDQCSSNLEHSYTGGFEKGSVEAKTFLAGQNVFSADKVEVWGFYS